MTESNLPSLIAHANSLGYDWVGATNDFASNAALASAASWERKVDPLNLGILPVLHA